VKPYLNSIEKGKDETKNKDNKSNDLAFARCVCLNIHVIIV